MAAGVCGQGHVRLVLSVLVVGAMRVGEGSWHAVEAAHLELVPGKKDTA